MLEKVVTINKGHSSLQNLLTSSKSQHQQKICMTRLLNNLINKKVQNKIKNFLNFENTILIYISSQTLLKTPYYLIYKI